MKRPIGGRSRWTLMVAATSAWLTVGCDVSETDRKGDTTTAPTGTTCGQLKEGDPATYCASGADCREGADCLNNCKCYQRHTDGDGDIIYSNPEQTAGAAETERNSVDVRYWAVLLLDDDDNWAASSLGSHGADIDAVGLMDNPPSFFDQIGANATFTTASSVLIAHAEMAGPIPESDPNNCRDLTLVLQTDADASNNWVPIDPWLNDTYQQGDKWVNYKYVALTDAWELSATAVTSTQQQVPSDLAARVAVSGNQVAFTLPLDQFDDPSLVTARIATGVHANCSFDAAGTALDITGTMPQTPFATPERSEPTNSGQ